MSLRQRVRLPIVALQQPYYQVVRLYILEKSCFAGLQFYIFSLTSVYTGT